MYKINKNIEENICGSQKDSNLSPEQLSVRHPCLDKTYSLHKLNSHIAHIA